MSESGYVLESFWFPYNPTGHILITQTSAFSAPARPIMPPLSHSLGTLQACWEGANEWSVTSHIPNQPLQIFPDFFSSANCVVGSQKVLWKQYHVVEELFLPADKILIKSCEHPHCEHTAVNVQSTTARENYNILKTLKIYLNFTSLLVSAWIN